MNLKKKSLFLNFSGYTLVNLFNSLTPFIVLPILTRNLSPEDIGIIDLFSTYSVFLTPLIGLCFAQSISKLYYIYEDNKNYLSTLFSCIFIFGASFVLLAAILLSVPGVFALEIHIKLLIFSVILYVSLNIIIEGFLLLKRNEEKIREFAFIRLLKSILEILLTIILLFFIKDYMLRVLAIILATLITSIYVIYLLIHSTKITFRLDKIVIRRIFFFSIPLVFHTFFATILNYADRYFIVDILDISQLGKYSVVYQLCMIMSLLINSFNMAWTPYFMKSMISRKEDFEIKFKKFFKFYWIALLLFAVLLYMIMPFIYQFYIGNDYKVDNLIYFTLLSSYFFNGLYRFKVSFLFYHEKTFLVAKLSFITSCINLILNYVWINKFGILGAALSTLVSYFALYILLEKALFNIKKNENTSAIL